MYTTIKTHFATTRGHNGRLFDTHTSHDALWVIIPTLLVISPAMLLLAAVGQAPIPDRLLDAVVFGAVLTLLWAAWQSNWLDETVGLFAAAITMAALGAFAPAAALVLGIASAALWAHHRAHRPAVPTRTEM